MFEIEPSKGPKSLYLATPLACNPSTEGFPWDYLRKIFIKSSEMAKVPNGVETLPKISIVRVGCTNVTDDRRTDDDASSRSLKTNKKCFLKCFYDDEK